MVETAAELDELFARLYGKLKKLASRVRWQGSNPTLSPTALVHEAYLKLRKTPADLASHSNEEVIGIFAHVMRQILVDATLRKRAQKRAPADTPGSAPVPVEVVFTIQEVVERLRKRNPRQGAIVDCRFYLGMTVAETAQALDISQTSVEREWREAKVMLNGVLRQKGSAHE